MRLVMVVPTYWSRHSDEGRREGDLVFDHPTPLDGEDTLGRLLRSIAILDDRDFELAVIVVPTTPSIAAEAESRVREIIEAAESPVTTHLFTFSHLDKTRSLLGENAARYEELLTFAGYPQVRNGCLLAARLLDAEAVVLIDDDEIFEDSFFFSKVKEGLEREFEDRRVMSLAGYYINPGGDYLLKKPKTEWDAHWPKYEVMDRAFEELIGKPPRYKRTPFAFGGNLTLHSDLYTVLPFDPLVTRGEDLDYLMMALMHGIPTVLDNELSIKHDAPPKSHPLWQQVRQDVIRFSYQRSKILAAGKYDLLKLEAENLDPYPGFFLRDDLDDRIEKTSKLLAEFYRSKMDEEGASESLRTLEYVREAALPGRDPIAHFNDLKERWQELMETLVGKTFDDL